jgi:hypothetical protein
MLEYRLVRSGLTVSTGTSKKKSYRLQLWNMTVVFYSFQTDQHSDIEINRYFFIFEFPAAAADKRKQFSNFEPSSPPIKSSAYTSNG